MIWLFVDPILIVLKFERQINENFLSNEFYSLLDKLIVSSFKKYVSLNYKLKRPAFFGSSLFNVQFWLELMFSHPLFKIIIQTALPRVVCFFINLVANGMSLIEFFMFNLTLAVSQYTNANI